MKRSLAIVVMLASGMVLSAAAQTLPPPPAPAAAPVAVPAKIAVIAFQAAVARTNEGLRDFGDLEKKYAPKEAALKTLSDEIDTLTKQLQDSGRQSKRGRAQHAAPRPSMRKRSNWTATPRMRKTTFSRICRMSSKALQSKVYDVMQSYAEQQGYTLILDVSQQQSPVLYAVNGTNITKPSSTHTT